MQGFLKELGMPSSHLSGKAFASSCQAGGRIRTPSTMFRRLTIGLLIEDDRKDRNVVCLPEMKGSLGDRTGWEALILVFVRSRKVLCCWWPQEFHR